MPENKCKDAKIVRKENIYFFLYKLLYHLKYFCTKDVSLLQS